MGSLVWCLVTSSVREIWRGGVAGLIFKLVQPVSCLLVEASLALERWWDAASCMIGALLAFQIAGLKLAMFMGLVYQSLSQYLCSCSG